MKFKIFAKAAASLLAASIIAASFPTAAFAEGGSNAPAAPSGPTLSRSAFSGGYTVPNINITKGSVFTLEAETYIPISNFTDGLDAWELTSGNNIFAFAVSNESFTLNDTSAAITNPAIIGSFLYVTAFFTDITYSGTGDSFTYNICYNSGGTSVTVPITISISECIMESASADPGEPSAAKFALASSNTYSLNAGSGGNITVSLKNINGGVYSNVAATLSSADGSVFVETTETQTSSSARPQFTFRASVPASTPTGVYNLTMNISVFNSKGDEVSTGSFNIPVRVESNVVSTGLSVSAYDVSKNDIQSGDSFELALTLKNDCNIDLSGVKVSLDGLDSSKFVLDGGFSSKVINIGKDGQAKVTFPLVACDGISNVRESIPVQVEYKINQNGDSAQVFSTSVILQCKPKEEKPNNEEFGQYDISMTDYSFSSGAVKKGTKFNLSLTLQNTSSKDIKNARVTVQELTGGKFAIDSGLTYRNFDIKAGETVKFTFPLIGCDGISSMREVIPVELSFGNVTSTVYTTVTCEPPEQTSPEDEVFAPPIIIQSYDFGGEYVTGGTAFPLKLTVQNADANTAIENLKVTISGGAGNGDSGVAFSPANSSNSFFIESLPAKGTTDIEIDLLPRADSKPDSYPVNVTFDYEYVANGKKAKGTPVTETITIPLQQEDRFTLNPAQYAESVGLGEMVYISTSFVNKGKSAVYNVTADVEGEGFDKSQGTYYVGNVNSGSEEYYDVQVTPNVEGNVKGEIVVTYEDSNGTQKEQRLPFSFNVISYSWNDPGMIVDPGFDDPGMMDPGMTEGEGGFPTWAWFAIGGGALVVIIIVIVIIVKHKKKKRELEDYDD